jgi:hypothetical protein
MYMSLTMLAADGPDEARSAKRLIRLSNHSNLLPRTKLVSFAAIVLIIVAHAMVMAASKSDFPRLGYFIEGVATVSEFLTVGSSSRAILRRQLYMVSLNQARSRVSTARGTHGQKFTDRDYPLSH